MPVKSVRRAQSQATPQLPRRLHYRQAQDWIAAAQADPQLLRDLVKHLRDDKELVVPSDIDLSAQACPGVRWRFNNFMRKKLELTSEEISLAMSFLVQSLPHLEHGGQGLVQGDPDTLTIAAGRLNEFLNVSPRSRQRWPSRLIGLYWVYRPSLLAPGMYIRGLLDIWFVGNLKAEGHATGDQSGLVRACEVHRHSGERGLGERGLDSALECPLLIEVYDGFAIAKKGCVFFFMSERFERTERGPLLVVRMHGFLPGDTQRPIDMAWGRAPGASDSGHAPPVVLQRVTPEVGTPGQLKQDVFKLRAGRDINKGLIEKCSILSAHQVPAIVLARMDAMNRESWFLADQLLRRDEPPSR